LNSLKSHSSAVFEQERTKSLGVTRLKKAPTPPNSGGSTPKHIESLRTTASSNSLFGKKGGKEDKAGAGAAESEEVTHETPVFVKDDPYGLIARPAASSLYEDDLLALCMEGVMPAGRLLQCCKHSVARRVDRAFFCCNLGASRKRNISMGRRDSRTARSMLWQQWSAAQGNFEGVFARLFDEWLLRDDPLLGQYWKHRDHGRLHDARDELNSIERRVLASMSLEMKGSSHLMCRYSDLQAMLPGGQAKTVGADSETADKIIHMKSNSGKYLHVQGLDSGTWPMDGGGVASCRRDVINKLPNVWWEMVAEVGNDMKIIHNAYQVERNVWSLALVPLWGNDFGSPSNTVRSDEPAVALGVSEWRATGASIQKTFTPLLATLVEGCTNGAMVGADIVRYTDAIVAIYEYFGEHGWVATWDSNETRAAWIKIWGERYNELGWGGVEAEAPNIDDMFTALGLFIRFLLPIAVPLSSEAVTVVHATHHGIQTLLGVVAKRKRGTALVIWDHGVLWRERLRAISNFRGFPLFARNTLIGLTRLCVFVNFRNADLIVPCCDTNVNWEQWLGGLRGDSHSFAMVGHRIGAVLNGMETDRFSPSYTTEEELPAVVMLSHVYELKGIKTAIKVRG